MITSGRLIAILLPLLVAGACSKAPAASPPAAADGSVDATAPPSAPPGPKALAVRLDPFRYFSGPPPAGWADPAFDDRTWAGPSAGPFAPKLPLVPTPLSTRATGFDAVPSMPLLLRARFAVTDAPRARVLELRVGYDDGFVAYVDGREIARRNVPASAPATGAPLLASAPHGPEVERIYIPVPSTALPSLSPDGNLLAVAVYPYYGRNAVVPTTPTAAVGLAAASGVRIVRGPYLAAPGEDKRGARAQIAWETDLPATGTAAIEKEDAGDGATPRQITAQNQATRQLIAVDNLVRGAAFRYHVEVESAPGDTAASAPARFETLPAPPAPLRFAVYGDMRYPGHAAHRAVIAALAADAPALVINTGDLTDEGSQESNWQRYFDITAPLGAIAPVIPALGNHDTARRGEGAPKSWALFGMPTPAPPYWTSFDLGGVHFVILDTNDTVNVEQREWLAHDLARARRHHTRGVFAFCHEPPWSHGLHGNSHRMIRDYAPLLAAGHTDVFFCGHDHIYERGIGSTPKGKLVYVVTGGGGAPLYNPRCQPTADGKPIGPPVGDVPGPLDPCPPTVKVLTKTFHYILVTVGPDGIQLCPKRPDGTEVEPCVHLPPHRR